MLLQCLTPSDRAMMLSGLEAPTHLENPVGRNGRAEPMETVKNGG